MALTGLETSTDMPGLCRRLHVSTYVVLLLAAGVLFLLNVPGQYVPYVGMPADEDPSDLRMVRERLEHGWPLSYLVRDDRIFLFRAPSGQWEIGSTAVWSFTEDFVSFSPWRLLANGSIALCVFAIVGLLAEYWRRQRRRVWQLRISDLLGLTALIALAVWYVLSAAKEYEREMKALPALGQALEGPPFNTDRPVRIRGGPTWLRAAIGESRFPKVFDRVVYADFQRAAIEQLKDFKRLKGLAYPKPGPGLVSLAQFKRLEALDIGVFDHPEPAQLKAFDEELAGYLAALARLPKLCFVRAWGPGVQARSLKVIAGFPRLRILSLIETDFSDDAIKQLADSESLEELQLVGEQISDETVAHLAHLPRLEVLSLPESHVTDAAFANLSRLTRLKRLYLLYTPVTGSGLHHLGGLSHLQHLSLPTDVDVNAIRNLQRRLPSLKIEVAGQPWTDE